MKRRHLGALALALTLLGASAGDLHAFGRGLFKRRAKQEAKKRAKREAAKKVAEETGVNVAGLVDGDASAVAKGMAKDAAMGAVAESAAGPYAKYLGMEPGAIKEALKAEIMEEQGVTRFSPPSQRRAVDNLVEERFGKVQKALTMMQSVARMKGKDMGGMGKLTGGGGESGGLHAAIEADRAVAKRNLEAAGMDSSVVDPLYNRASATADLADEARARADAGLAPLRGAPAAKALADRKLTAADTRRLEKLIEEQVYEEQGVTRFTPRYKRVRAEAQVKSRVEEAIKDGSAWDLLAGR